MPTIDEIKELSDEELFIQLKSHGVNLGPITESTRPLFERKLDRLLNGTLLECSLQEAKSKIEQPDDTMKEEQKAPTCSQLLYYAVQLPSDARTDQSIDVCVFTDKKEALQLVKKHPGARFKIFSNVDQAKNYASQSSDMVPPSPRPDLSKKDGTKPVSEGSSFRGPKPPEVIQFRRALEQGNLDQIRNTVFGNPRYLISSGDTPVILQENFRYNALHVCASKNQPASAEEVLSLLQDESVFKLMYPEDTVETRQGRMTFLTDLYLNTPDKGINETPLHFACKFGNADVVKVLVNQKATDRSRINKFGELPKDIVCNRMRRGEGQTKAEITALLEDQVFVPLVRAVDDSTPAQVANPVAPENLSKDLKAEVISNPKEAPVVVRAMAGPMSPLQAEKFRKTWTTPPSPSLKDKMMYASIRRGDSTKGLERIGRQLAHSLHIKWNEYWEFLDAFVDLSTPEGLDILESFLHERNNELCKKLEITNQVDLLGPLLDKLDLSTCNGDICTPKKFTGSNIFADYCKDGYDSSFCNENKVKDNPFMPKSLPSSCETNSFTQTNECKLENVMDNNKKQTNLDNLTETCAADSGQNDGIDDLLSEALSGLMLTSPTNNIGSECDKSKAIDSTDSFSNTDTKCIEGKDISLIQAVDNSNLNLSAAFTESCIGDGDNNITKDITGYELDPVEQSSTCNPLNKDQNNSFDVRCNLKTSGESVQNESCTEEESDIESDGEDPYATATESSDPDDSIFEESFDALDGTHDRIATPERLYLFGKEPTKTDVDVLRALDNVRVSPVSHPHIFKWRNTVTSYSESSRTRWTATPDKRSLSQSTPKRQNNFSLRSRSSRSAYTPSLLASPLDEDGPISFLVSDSSMSDTSCTSDDSVHRIRANLIPDFLSASNV